MFICSLITVLSYSRCVHLLIISQKWSIRRIKDKTRKDETKFITNFEKPKYPDDQTLDFKLLIKRDDSVSHICPDSLRSVN